ncbi:ATP-dependent DNA helicase PIF1-like protein [Leptotrombidium deliense]|uniref:ATP-dependent DNA helicase PIF1-like protein n=1 Tax=Leptotrombidium deliense TaxID=299467 RepID=A0A443QHI5_9ACAR|nr:ATP-dependent DNA helicase PIF1-like protein [Leptotrombidium deliense]
MKLLDEKMYDLLAVDFFTQEYINTLPPTGLPPYKLMLKVKTIVMLIRNLCVTNRVGCSCYDNQQKSRTEV